MKMAKIFFQREKILSIHFLQWNPNNFLINYWRLPGCIRYECLGGDVPVGFKTNAFWWWAHKHFLPFPVRAFLAVSRGCTPWVFWVFCWNFMMSTLLNLSCPFRLFVAVFPRVSAENIWERIFHQKPKSPALSHNNYKKKRLNGPQSGQKNRDFLSDHACFKLISHVSMWRTSS